MKDDKASETPCRRSESHWDKLGGGPRYDLSLMGKLRHQDTACLAGDQATYVAIKQRKRHCKDQTSRPTGWSSFFSMPESLSQPFGWKSRSPPDKKQPTGLWADDVLKEKVLSKAPQWLFIAGYLGEQLWLMWEALLLFTVLTWSCHYRPTLATAPTWASPREV